MIVGTIMAVMLFSSCSIKKFNIDIKLNACVTSPDGNLEGVKEAVKDGVNLNWIISHDETRFSPSDHNPVTLAMDRNNYDLAKYLIEQGADPNYMGTNGFSLLMEAASSNDIEFCDLLLKHGAKIDQKGKKDYAGYTALEFVYVENDDCNMMTFLLKHGAKITPLTLKVAMGSPNVYSRYKLNQRILKELLATGQKSGLSPILESAILGESKKVAEFANAGDLNKEDRQKVLFSTAAFGDVETMKLLLSKGLDIQSLDQSMTLLDIAAKYNNKDMVKFLYEKGIKLETKNDKGQTALTLAISNNQLDNAKYLLSVGAIFQVFSNRENDVLAIASSNGNIDMLKFILDNGYPLDNSHVFTAMLEAISNKHTNVLQYFLVNKKISPHIEYMDDDLLSEACLWGNIETVKYLVEHGADVNGVKIKGRPLYYAAQKRKTEIAAYLLEKGADAKVIGVYSDGSKVDSILVEAIRSGSFDIVKLLVEHGADLTFKDMDKEGKEIDVADSHSKNILDYLIKKGAKIN